jgi:polysaccharide deacetylase family protein (PEP-CTERM system associated)
MINILTFDVEDWHVLACRRVTGELGESNGALQRQLDAVLLLLAEHNVRATFFVLGMAAEADPGLVRQIAAAGHEIASHGYSHVPVYRLSRAEFGEDAGRSKRLLEDLLGHEVTGYRAAEFSIRSDSLWALDVLARLGFAYDSSIFPVRHRRYGIHGFDSGVARYTLDSGASIVEIPLSAVHWAGWDFPAAGGGYFRWLPQSAIHSLIRKLNQGGRAAVTYFHPYEFDRLPLQVFGDAAPGESATYWRGRWFQFHQNLNRPSMAQKLRSLLERFRFVPCRDFLQGESLGECRELLSVAG